MNKLFSILLSICAVFTLTSCSPASPISATDSPSEIATSTIADTTLSATPSNGQKSMAAVSVPTVTEVTTSETGVEIFRYVYQNMTLVAPEQEVADKVIVDFLNRIDQSLSPAQDIRQQALAAYNGAENWIPYLYTLTYSPTRIDQGVLSLYGTNIIYSGSSHPSYNCVSVNYDLITGNTLTLGSILVHENVLKSLEALVLAELSMLEEEKFLRADYKDTVNTRFAGNESYDEDWFFTPSGLCFYFPPYEIAPYSSGIIIIEIPYNKLTGIIADSFFPAEQNNISGDVIVQSLTDVDLTKFTQIGELILDNTGQTQLLLHTDSFLQYPRVKVKDTSTGESYIAFASQYLTPGDAIMLKTTPDDLENLTFLFEANGVTIELPITAN